MVEFGSEAFSFRLASLPQAGSREAEEKEKKQTIALSQMKEGESGVIASMPDDDPVFTRLQEVGFLPGETTIRLLHHTASGPIVEVLGAKYGIRHADAEKIQVRMC